MTVSNGVKWLAKQRKLGLTTKQIEKKYNKLLKS